MIDMHTKKIKVAFIVHNASIWAALHSVYIRMAQPDSGFIPKVFTIPCDHASRGNYSGEEKTYLSLAEIGVKVIRPDYRSMSEFLDVVKDFAPDYLFRQAPWERHLPPEFRVENLNFSRLCYIPYGFMTAKIEDHQFNQRYHHTCWRIFCETKIHLLLYEKNSLIGSRNVTVTGFPKFETLWARRNERFWPTNASSGDVKIIWAPHHSITSEWLGFSTFLDNHMCFLRLAQQNPNLHIVLRPHPALFSKLRSNGAPQKVIEEYLTAFTALPNTALYEKGDFTPLFGSSDLLISDGIGFFSEYILTGKPIIYTDSGRSIGFNDAGNLIAGGLYRAEKFAEVASHLDSLLNGKDPLRKSRETIGKMLFDPNKVFPSQKIIEILKSSQD